MFAFRKLRNIVQRRSAEFSWMDVEKRDPRPYCRSQHTDAARPLSLPKAPGAAPNGENREYKEIGKWNPSRHNRTFRIPSSTLLAKNGTTLRSTSSAV